LKITEHLPLLSSALPTRNLEFPIRLHPKSRFRAITALIGALAALWLANPLAAQQANGDADKAQFHTTRRLVKFKACGLIFPQLFSPFACHLAIIPPLSRHYLAMSQPIRPECSCKPTSGRRSDTR